MSQFVYRSSKVEVRESPISGSGLFALADIIKDELICIKSGHIVNSSQLKSLDQTCQNYWFQSRRFSAWSRGHARHSKQKACPLPLDPRRLFAEDRQSLFPRCSLQQNDD